MYSNSTHLVNLQLQTYFTPYSSANVERLWCCHILTDNGYGRGTDRKKCNIFFIRCSSSDESRLDGDEGLRGACEELIKRMSNAYLTDK